MYFESYPAMNYKTSLASFIAVLCTCLLTGCSTINSWGNDLLSTLGFTPAKSSFDGKATLGEAGEEFTKEQEYYLGRAVAARLLSMYPRLTDATVTAYVNRVGTAVTWASDNPNTFGGYHFLVLDSQEVNAISAPGGYIFISKGLLDKLPNEETLAAVLAHEVSHVELQHGVKTLENDSKSSNFKSALQLAGSLNCNELVGQVAVILGTAVDDLVDRLVISGYNRDFEYEADRNAQIILYRLGYDPDALNQVLKILETEDNAHDEGWFKTHPAPHDRIVALASVPFSGTSESGGTTFSESGKLVRSVRFNQTVRH